MLSLSSQLFYLFASAQHWALSLLSTLQPPPSAGGSAAGGGGAAGSADAPMGCAGGGLMGWGYIAVMIGIFWFLVISPQRKQQKAQEEMLKALQKGDIVRTSGGIRGEILTLDEREVTLKIADKTKINVLRAFITGLDSAVNADAAKAASEDK